MMDRAGSGGRKPGGILFILIYATYLLYNK